MKKNSRLEKIRKRVPDHVKKSVDHSFAIVDRIEKVMTQKGITQRELAERLGKRESEISRWMRGMHNFTVKTIAKLEVALGEPIMQIATQHSSVFIMQITNGPSKMMLAIHGNRENVQESGSMYVLADGAESITDELLHQLN